MKYLPSPRFEKDSTGEGIHLLRALEKIDTKKGKYSTNCQSYRPITVSPVLCKLMESLVINVFNQTCSTLEN